MKATKEMIDAGSEAALRYMVENGGNSIAVIWDAMWAAQPEQEPVAVVEEVSHDGYLFKQIVWKVQPHSFDYGTKFYTTPPQRTWVGLTDDEREAIANATIRIHGQDWAYATAIEAKLKEKNNA